MKRPFFNLLVLLAALTLFNGCGSMLSNRQPLGQHPHRIEIRKTLDYLLYLPDNYNDSKEEWPLMLFLHGAGERGSVIDSVKKHGPPKLVDQIPNMPFIIVSPQCPENEWWTSKVSELNDLLDYIIQTYRVDEMRIYCTGLSMGGFGTWAIATSYPQRFAAIAPICGGGDVQLICGIKDVPVWAFHGAKDKVVPIERTQELVDALKACGGDVRFTIYPDAGHDSWTETYKNPDLYKWFLDHSLK